MAPQKNIVRALSRRTCKSVFDLDAGRCIQIRNGLASSAIFSYYLHGPGRTMAPQTNNGTLGGAVGRESLRIHLQGHSPSHHSFEVSQTFSPDCSKKKLKFLKLSLPTAQKKNEVSQTFSPNCSKKWGWLGRSSWERKLENPPPRPLPLPSLVWSFSNFLALAEQWHRRKT